MFAVLSYLLRETRDVKVKIHSSDPAVIERCGLYLMNRFENFQIII